MIQPNPDIEAIIHEATELAIAKNHEYVTLEHLLSAMITHETFYSIIRDFGIDVISMKFGGNVI